MHYRRWTLLCLPLLTYLSLTPVLAADPPAEQVVRQLEESLDQLESELAEESPSADGIRRQLAELRYLSSSGATPVGDLLTRLEGQLGRLSHGAESSDRLPELRRRAELTISALRAKLAAGGGEAGQPGAAPSADSIVAPPDNDSCANATAVTAGTVFGTTVGATNDGSASCGGSGSAPDVWYSYTATADGLVTFDTEGSLLDTVLSLHSACPDAGGDYELTCNDDFGGALDSLVGRQMTSGDTVLVRVSGAGGATGEFQLTVDDTTGGIQGTVTKDSSGVPLAGVVIRVYNNYGWWEGGAVTGADGTYLVPGLGAQDHLVEAEHNGMIREFWDDVQCVAFCYIEDVGTPIPVSGDLVSGIDFALSPGGTITGVITDDRTGEPLDSSYYTYYAQAHAYDLSGNPLRSARTDAEGRYVLGGLPEEVKLSASALRYRGEVWDDLPCDPDCDPVNGTTVQVEQGSSADGYDFGLTRLGSIAGTITDAATASPVPYASVKARQSGGLSEWQDQADSQGEYLLEGLTAGDYFVYTDTYEYANEVFNNIPCAPQCPVSSGDPVAVSLDTTSAGIDFTLTRLGSISGSLTTEDGGWFDGYVEVYDTDGQYVEAGSVYGSDTTWTVSFLYPGTYYVLADPYWNSDYEATLYDDLGCEPDCDVTQGIPVEVTTGTTVVGINFSIKTCSGDSYQSLQNLSLWGSAAYEACREIQVGAGVTVKNGGHLNLTAGEAVSFANGFQVESGGGMTVTAGPAADSN